MNPEVEKILSEKQLETLKTLRKIDEKADLYEMNYLSDYNLDELIKKSSEKFILGRHLRELIYSHILPNDPNPIMVKNLWKVPGGCSSFYCTDEKGNPLLSRNYDMHHYLNESNILLHTAPKDGYASVGMTTGSMYGISKEKLAANDPQTMKNLLLAPFSTTDGINEKGLAVAIHILNEGRTCQITNKPLLSSGMVVRFLLDRAATVEEAIKLLENFDIGLTSMYDNELTDLVADFNFHWILADATGKRAIIEIVNRKMHVIYNPVTVDYNVETGIGKIEHPNIEKDYLILTNFYVAPNCPNNWADGYWRYQTINECLEKNSKIPIDEAFKILEKVKFFKNDKDHINYLKFLGKDPEVTESWEWCSLWSEVFDIANLKVNISIREDFTKRYSFGVKME